MRSRRQPCEKNYHPKGFTLLELLLALAIFAIIGISTVKHIQQIQTTKDSAFKELDLYNEMRAAISIMRYDLNQAFHVLYDDMGSQNKQLILQNQPVAHTLFDGRKSELVFTSLSHRVYYTGKRESEQTEISYFLQEKKPGELPSLMKRESEIIDSDLFQGGSVSTILENVESLQFQYWDEKQLKWLEDWNSDGGDSRDRFPLAVKIRVAVRHKGNQKLEVETQFKLGFPNNQPILVQF